jgi:hypothetical protein
MISEDLLQLQSELRVHSVKHSEQIARIRKEIQAVINYELTIAIEMACCKEWDVSPSRIMSLLESAELRLSNIVSGESL